MHWSSVKLVRRSLIWIALLFSCNILRFTQVGENKEITIVRFDALADLCRFEQQQKKIYSRWESNYTCSTALRNLFSYFNNFYGKFTFFRYPAATYSYNFKYIPIKGSSNILWMNLKSSVEVNEDVESWTKTTILKTTTKQISKYLSGKTDDYVQKNILF